ncbi:MAG: hypothetical protein ABI947_07200 [Chloroflexota bacterium]
MVKPTAIFHVRTDIVGAILIRRWLNENVPGFAPEWIIEADLESDFFADHLMKVSSIMQKGYVAQSALALAAIRRWQLHDVALLAGGRPAPLSPTPDQVKYYTDIRPEAVEEATNQGYNALRVDVRSEADLEKIADSETLIGTGLIHFLPDEALTSVFISLAQAGIKQAVFNNGGLPPNQTNAEFQIFVDTFIRLGHPLFIRSVEQMAALLPDGWEITDACEIDDLLPYMEPVGEKLRGMPSLFNTYLFSQV